MYGCFSTRASSIKTFTYTYTKTREIDKDLHVYIYQKPFKMPKRAYVRNSCARVAHVLTFKIMFWHVYGLLVMSR